jgi:hypothetical protein
MKTFRTLAALLLVAATAVTAVTAGAQTTPIKLTGAGTTVVGNVYVGPYSAVLGTGPGSASIDIFCVDYLNESSIGQTWNVFKTSLATGADLSKTRFGGTVNALENYRKAAWLTTLFAVQPTARWGDIHRTIWNLFTGAAPDPATSPLNFLAMANSFYAANATTYDWGRFTVLSDAAMRARGTNGIRPGGVQEFITDDVTVTPEPMTMMLVGTGLAGIAATRRRRRRDSGSATA